MLFLTLRHVSWAASWTWQSWTAFLRSEGHPSRLISLLVLDVLWYLCSMNCAAPCWMALIFSMFLCVWGSHSWGDILQSWPNCDCCPSNTTCVLCCRKSCIHWRLEPQIPRWWGFRTNLSSSSSSGRRLPSSYWRFCRRNKVLVPSSSSIEYPTSTFWRLWYFAHFMAYKNTAEMYQSCSYPSWHQMMAPETFIDSAVDR